MRENAKYILWIVLGAFMITIVAIWGARATTTDSKSNPDAIARVGKTDISYTLLGEEWQAKVQQLYEQGIKVTDEKEKEMKKELLNQIIEKRLLLDYAEKLNIMTSDEEVAQAISQIPAFNDKGKFDKDRYVQVLTNARIKIDDFENEQKESIILAKLKNQMITGIKVTTDELKAYFAQRERKVTAGYVYFNYKNFLDEIKIDEEKMKDYYAVNKKNYEKPDRVKASHILIRPDASATSPTGRSDEAAMAFAGDLLKKIKAGASFESLAKKYSQDPGSGAKGGELGWFSKGQMVPEFEKTAFDLKPGELSGVVKTQFGYHIIKVTGKEAGVEPTYATARPKVLAEMQKQEGLKMMKDKAAQMKDMIKDPSDLEKLAPKFKVSVLTSPLFNDDTKLASFSEDFKDTMLDMNKGDVSPVITGESGYYIAKIVSESKSPVNDSIFAKKSSALDSKLKALKYAQIQKDLIEKLKVEEKVEIFEKNM
jgi:peptidyl-prolyl cis-trans isomerase D